MGLLVGDMRRVGARERRADLHDVRRRCRRAAIERVDRLFEARVERFVRSMLASKPLDERLERSVVRRARGEAWKKRELFVGFVACDLMREERADVAEDGDLGGP